MKKLIPVIMGLGLILSSYAYAADVVITITIPDQQVARVQAAVNGTLHCKGATAKECLKTWLIQHIRTLVKGYEHTVDSQDFEAGYQEMEVQ